VERLDLKPLTFTRTSTSVARVMKNQLRLAPARPPKLEEVERLDPKPLTFGRTYEIHERNPQTPPYKIGHLLQ
jgi:hypothetical protein